MTTVDPLTISQNLLVGFLQLLADDPGSPFTYDPDANYTADQLGLFEARLPADKPDRAVAAMVYPLSAEPVRAQSATGIQFRSRSARDAGVFDVMGVNDAITNALGGRFPLTLPTGVRVSSLVWTSGVWLGTDQHGRDEWSSNWTASYGYPGTYRN